MGYWDYKKGTLRDYHRDPFPHSLLRTRETKWGTQLGLRSSESFENPFLSFHLSQHRRAKLRFRVQSLRSGSCAQDLVEILGLLTGTLERVATCSDRSREFFMHGLLLGVRIPASTVTVGSLHEASVLETAPRYPTHRKPF